MNKNAFGIICANYETSGFGSLMNKRTMSSLPFGGRYRMIDFPLSAMVHAEITAVGLIMPYYYRSLIDHVGTGKAWGLDRKIDGLFPLPGSAYSAPSGDYKLRIGDLLENYRFLERRPEGANAVILASSKVCNLDLKMILAEHEKSGKEATVVFYTRSGGKRRPMDILILSRETLMRITNMYKNHPYESLYAAMMTFLGENQINEYVFDGYVADIRDIGDYVNASKDLLKPEVHAELFNPDRLILTKTQDEAPALYRNGSSVKNSLVAAGCVIEGEIENCILFRNVTVEKDTVLQNCIIMQHATVRSGARLSNVILDKYACVGKDVKLEGGSKRPIIIPKNDLI